MSIITSLRASLYPNHNQTLVRERPQVHAGLTANHSQTLVRDRNA